MYHTETQVGPLQLTFQFQLIYAAYHPRTLELCRLGDAGGIMEMQPQQGNGLPSARKLHRDEIIKNHV